MHWKVLAPFIQEEKVGWIPSYISAADQSFEVVPARYHHDRSQKFSGGREWRNYFAQAARAWFGPSRGRRDVGFLTCFPQLPVCVGLLKRFTFSRAPIIAWMFNMGSTPAGMKGRLARFALKSIDYFVVHSTAEIDIYSKWLSIPKERFLFAPLSIDTHFQIPGTETKNCILSMGSANRDYACLLEAIAPLKYPTVIVAGKHAVSNLSIPDYVEIRSGLTLEQCHELSKAASVNVVPIKDTNAASGQVTLLETMLYGKAVIATDCAGTKDYMEDGKNGLLVPPRDPEKLREKIELLWHDAELRARLGQEARQSVLQNSSFEGLAPVMLNILRKCSARNA
jgi:glycosyltransferase involved in cell wall biosynthesis